jgi:hypothetical protein
MEHDAERHGETAKGIEVGTPGGGARGGDLARHG